MPLNLVELVMEDHREARARFDQVRLAPVAEKREAFRELVAMLVSHETAESLILYPAISRFLPNGEQAARARVAEHRAQEALLSRLQRLDVASPAFDVVLGALSSLHASHVAEEEQLCVPLLESVSSSALLRRLGERYDAIRKAAPLHHPANGTDAIDVARTPLPRLADEAHRRAHQALARRAWTASIAEAVRGAA